MRPVITFVRTLTNTERQCLQEGLRSTTAFTLRRCQILLASAAGQTPALIARNLGCTARSARNAVHAFDTEGLACLKEKSSRAAQAARPLLDAAFDEPLRHLLHQSPRTQGQLRSTWTLALVAQVCHAKGWTPRVLSLDTIRLAIQRLGVSWKRAKHWITLALDPPPTCAKKARDRLIRLAATHPDWVLGFQDECWWSRLAQPNLHAWAGTSRCRLQELAVMVQAVTRGPTGGWLATGCCGATPAGCCCVLWDGRPVSQVTTDYLAWVCGELLREGKQALLLVWGTTPLGTSVSVCVPGSRSITGGPSGRGWGAAARVPPAEQESVAELD